MSFPDLHRDLGRMEGRLDAVEDRLSKMEAVLERIDERTARLEATEQQRKGGWAVIALVASAISAGAAFIIQHFWK
jgi:hypothetical protein